MNETIYLVLDKWGVKRMTKNLPSLNRGEIPVKLNVTVAEEAFREPVLVKEVTIEDWRQGVDIADVEFKESVITEDEAALIREQRIMRMKEILEEQGYEITRTETENE